MKFVRETLREILDELFSAEPPPVNRRGMAFVFASVALSVAWSVAMACWPGSDGRTAAFLSVSQVALYVGYVAATRDAGMGRLLVFGAVFGVVELLADALCVHYTGTLDYAPAGSAPLFLSPWWMPLAWMVVAVQIGYVGAGLIARFGAWRGAALTGLLGAVNIPFYEEMAYHANWWRYVQCFRVWHTPVYIVVAELVIGCALGLLAAAVLRAPSRARAAWYGVLGGLATVVGGMVGYGLVEFIPDLLAGRPLLPGLAGEIR